MQKISSIHQLILVIQQVLQSHNLKDHARRHAKIIQATFGFPKFLSTHQKSVYYSNSFLRYSQF